MQYASHIAPTARVARFAALFAVTLVALTAFCASAQAYSRGQWRIDVVSGYPSTNTPFALYNEDNEKGVRYGERDYGINLVWTGSVVREWQFARSSGTTGPLRFGERLALLNTRENKWVGYMSRTFGINLGWSSTPRYEWLILGGTDGQPVTTEAHHALFNTVEPDYLIYGERDWGINLVWAKDGSQHVYCTYSAFC